MSELYFENEGHLDEISVALLGKRYYFRLGDILDIVQPSLLFEHLIYNAAIPPKGKKSLVYSKCIEFDGDEIYQFLEDPKCNIDKVYIDKVAALAILLDCEDEYPRRVAKAIIDKFGITKKEKSRLYMLRTNLWIVDSDEYKESCRRANAEYNDYIQSRCKAVSKLSRFRSNWDEVDLC